MSTLIKSNITQAVGQAIIDDIFLQKSRYYYTIGRAQDWDNEPTPADTVDTEAYEITCRNDALFMKQIDGTSLSFLIKRIDYTPNTTYEIYDDTISLVDKDFYVITSDYNVYKCLYNNNNKPSTIQPYGISSKAITYSDGYVWKFIYTIPAPLRNKFFSPLYMPVYNSITERYFSRGSINSVIVDSSGSGYTTAGTSIIVSGDGHLEYNPQQLSNFSVKYSGSGYTTPPLIDTTDQFTTNTIYTLNSQVVQGQYLKLTDISGTRTYRVESSGATSATTNPTHYYGVANNGTATLRHIGTKPKLTSTIDTTAVGSLRIIEPGFGYTTTPTATKAAPGAGVEFYLGLQGGILVLADVLVNGTGYTNTTVSVSEPSTIADPFATTTSVLVDDIIKADVSGETYYYRVTIAGTTGVSAPTHTSGASLSGTAMLLVIAKRARVEAVLGVLSSVVAYADVREVDITQQGSGYNQNTTVVTFSGGNPVYPAVGNAEVSSGKIVKIIVTYPGYGYETAPDIIITGDGTLASAIPIMQFGYGYQATPSIIIGEPDDVNGVMAQATVTTLKSEAKLNPVIIDGALRGISIEDAGVGYTQATLTVVGDGVGATISPLFASGDLSSIQAQMELTAIPGTVSSILVTHGGLNISSILCNVVGDGTGATCVAKLVSGVVTEILVTNAGQNYTNASVEFIVNDGVTTLPAARIILSPIKGHGSNPIREMYSHAIAMYGIFADDTNNGYPFNNEFRQLAIYKNPLKYNSSALLSSKFASTCGVVSVSTVSIPIAKNVILTNARDSRQYRVIDFTESSILVQPLTKSTIYPKDVLSFIINTITYNLIVADYTSPQADKYSGDILFIDNKVAFSPTADAAVSVSTSINLV